MGTSGKRTTVQPVSETMESKKRGFALDWIGKISKCFRKKSLVRTSEEENKPTKPTTVAPVVVVEELFGTLSIDDEKKVKEADNEEREGQNQVENEEDSGNDDFETKVIDDNRKCGKLNSQSSHDSGYSDKNNDACEELTASMDKLELEGEKKKKKKIVRRLISRGPTPRKTGKVRSGQPYPEHRPPSPVLNNHAEISQLNLQTLTGGRVTFKCDQVDYEIPTVILAQNTEENSYGRLDMINEVIAEDRSHNQDIDIQCHNEFHDNHSQPFSTIISFDNAIDDLPFEDFIKDIMENESMANETGTSNAIEDIVNENLYLNNSFCRNGDSKNELPSANPVQVSLENDTSDQIENESIANTNDSFNSQLIDKLLLENEPLSKTVDLLAAEITWPFATDYTNDTADRTQISDDFGHISSIDNQSFSPSMFPTPPRSVNVHSPCSHVSGNSPSHTASSLLSGMSPNAINNLETFQECARDAGETKLETLKQFKERQKEIVSRFEKDACCQRHNTTMLEQFHKCLDKLKPVVRLNLGREIAKLDVEKEGFRILYGAITDLSVGASVDIALSTFGILCQRILSIESAAFLDQRGYKLLEDAVIKGHNYPILTQFAVECIRNAISDHPELVAGKTFLFDEVIEGGDNLVCYCARMGDQYADSLYRLVHHGVGELPLFDIRHTNTEGHSALHVACRPRSGRPARLRTVHVLLAHGGADIYQGDKNGNDTALHHAVNDSACDLSVVLLLFSFLPQKDWHTYANKKNGSSMTPADYAKRYSKKQSDSSESTDKVLLFLKKKCRKIPLKSDSDN